MPSPSALVVLLAALALHRAWFGLLLVIAYGAGMALTLSGAGLLLVRTRALAEKLASARDGHGPRLAAINTALPVVAAAVIIVSGALLVARGVAGL